MSTMGSDEVREMFCEPCCKDGFKNSITADGFCTKCVEYLCATCLRYHKKHLPHHHLQDTNDMPQDFCLEPCLSHPAEIVKFYCKTCDVFACPCCKSDRHTNCTEVLHLPEISANFEKSDELKDLNMKINKAKKELGNVRGLIKKGEKHAEMLKTDVRKGMKKQREDMNLRYDTSEIKISRTVLKIHNDDKAEIEKQSRKADAVADELATVQADIQNTTSALQRCKLFIKSKNAVKVVNSVEERLKQIKEGIVEHDYSYEPVENAAHERELGLIRTEGKIKFTDIKGALASYIYLEARMAMQLVRELRSYQKFIFKLVFAIILLAVLNINLHFWHTLSVLIIAVMIHMSKIWFPTERRLYFIPWSYDLVKFMLVVCIGITKWMLKCLKYKDVKDCKLYCQLQEWFKQLHSTYIGVKTKDSVMCDVTGLCFLSVNHLAAVDNSSSSVKIIDINQESVITELALGGRLPFINPWDVTKIGGEQLAVTIPHSETICFLQLTCCFGVDLISLSLSRTVSVRCQCYGIVYNDDKLMITSCGIDSAVKILDLDGNILQSYTKDSKCEDFFQNPYYIVISPDQTSVYVSDYHREQVTKLSMDGTVLAVYKHPELTNLFGMTTDKSGKVYVCGWSNIFVLSSDLAEGQKLTDVEEPLNNIAYCDKTNTCWLASWKHDNISSFSNGK